MRRALILISSLTILFGSSPNANAANLKVTLEVWDTSAVVSFDEGGFIPSIDEIKKQLLRKCKTELDYQVGTSIRAVNQSQATVGIGKITSVKIGKVYKAIRPGYQTEEQVNGVVPPDLDPSYISPCIFSGSVSNLRSANFYTFVIGVGETGEYDSLFLSKKGWKLNLVREDLVCGIFEDLNIPRGCSDY